MDLSRMLRSGRGDTKSTQTLARYIEFVEASLTGGQLPGWQKKMLEVIGQRPDEKVYICMPRRSYAFDDRIRRGRA